MTVLLDSLIERYHPRALGRRWYIGPTPVEVIAPEELAFEEVIGAYYEPAPREAESIGSVIANWEPGVFDAVRGIVERIPEGDSTLFVEDQDDADECKAIFVFERGKRRIFVALSRPGAVAYLTVARCARALSVACLVEGGVIPFHASCVLIDNRAVCFTGNKKAGKTTTLVNLVKAGAGAFVSNDKVYFRRGPEGLTVAAVPRSVNVRDGTFQALGLDTLLSSIRALVSTPEAKAAVVRRSRLERWSLAPRLFARCMNAGVAYSGTIGCVVLPRLTDTDRAQLERMDVAQAFQLFSTQILPDPFPHDPYFQALVASSPPMSSATVLGEWLAEAVPAYHLSASERTNEQVPTIIRRACSELGRGRGVSL